LYLLDNKIKLMGFPVRLCTEKNKTDVAAELDYGYRHRPEESDGSLAVIVPHVLLKRNRLKVRVICKTLAFSPYLQNI
jgi:hypothetical protein